MTPTEFDYWMNRMGYSRDEAAAALGVETSTIHSWMRKANPRGISKTVEKLCYVLSTQRVVWQLTPATIERLRNGMEI